MLDNRSFRAVEAQFSRVQPTDDQKTDPNLCSSSQQTLTQVHFEMDMLHKTGMLITPTEATAEKVVTPWHDSSVA